MTTYLLHLIAMFGLSLALVVAADIALTGLGVFNVALASVAAIGGYLTAVLSVHAGLPILLGGWIGLAWGIIAGLGVAAIAWRLNGNLLVIGTLCLALIVSSILRNGDWMTGGARGLSGVAPMLRGGTVLANAIADSAAALVLAALALVAWSMLRVGPAHRSLVAVRDQATACQAWGVNPRLMVAIGLGVSGAVAGLAGSVYVGHLRVISPAAFSLADAFGLLSVAVLMSNVGLWGGIAGAALLVIAPEVLALIAPTSMAALAAREALLAALLPAMLLLRRR